MSARVGSRWRLLAWEGRGYASRQVALASAGASVLDEVVIDDWFHLEQMDTREWWLCVGETHFYITVGRDRKARIRLHEGALARPVARRAP